MKEVLLGDHEIKVRNPQGAVGGAGLKGELRLSDDGKWLRYEDRPSEPLELEWRTK